ncbi:MAG: glycoside hydrolase family 43 protein [Prevotella sp.]|nr:glycoside hydrolase family 43 protein [Prevotella sp.]
MRRVLLLIWTACCLQLWAQELRNPIIPGFHPDPSVCRVGADYYLVNSSFEYFPGVPVFHSTDLQQWEQIGNVLTRESQLSLREASGWQGIYAPTIRYHQGRYYMITTNVGRKNRQEGEASDNFMVTATNPAGPWSDPIWLKQGGIDPSLYFEGSRCYMVSNPDNVITLCEIDPRTGRQLTQSRAIWQGTGGRWPEGPHIYKRGVYYYLLISEGGTELAHSVTIARSRSIYGPYEANPHNPILTHCSLKGQDSPIQGTGHGDLVEDADGKWWMTFLAYRNNNGSYHHLGRETFLAPVEWTVEGWPVVNGGEPIVLNEPPKQRRYVDFTKPLGPEMVYIQNPDSTAYWQHDGKMRLYGSVHEMPVNRQPTFLGMRQEAALFTMDTKISGVELNDGDEAGLCVYQMHDGNVQCCVNNFRGVYRLKVRLNLKGVRTLLLDRSVGSAQIENLWLRAKSNGKYYNFYYSTNGEKYHWLESVQCSLLSTETVGGFTGVMLGIYAHMGSAKYQSGRSYADFDYIEYSEQ